VSEVDDLVVNSELLATVRDDEDTDGAGTTTEGLLEAAPEVTLVDNAKTLLDLTGLGHGDELTVIADIDETVLLEDGSEKGVKDDRRRGVRDNARLLVQLLGEQVNTKVTVLTGLGRGGDADDLAGAVLQDHEIANADVVARDGEGVSLACVDGGDVVGGRTSALAADGTVNGLGDVELAVSGSVAVLAAHVGGLVLGGVALVFTHLGVVGRFLAVRRKRRNRGLGFQRRLDVMSFFDDSGFGDDGRSKLVYAVDGVRRRLVVRLGVRLSYRDDDGSVVVVGAVGRVTGVVGVR
jgi:hypothetical protein